MLSRNIGSRTALRSLVLSTILLLVFGNAWGKKDDIILPAETKRFDKAPDPTSDSPYPRCPKCNTKYKFYSSGSPENYEEFFLDVGHGDFISVIQCPRCDLYYWSCVGGVEWLRARGEYTGNEEDYTKGVGLWHSREETYKGHEVYLNWKLGLLDSATARDRKGREIKLRKEKEEKIAKEKEEREKDKSDYIAKIEVAIKEGDYNFIREAGYTGYFSDSYLKEAYNKALNVRLGESTAERLRLGFVRIGDTLEMVKLAKPSLELVEKYRTESGTEEVWYSGSKKYVFRNGKLIKQQTQ